MASGWFARIRSLLPERKARPGAELPATEAEYYAEHPGTPPPAKSDGTGWIAGLFAYMPLAMLIVGILLTACSQLIGGWAFLGYLLVVAAPILFALHRIERRLSEIRDKTRL